MTNNTPHDSGNDSTPEELRLALKHCEAQLVHAQQEISGLLYAISHDLRAPLRALTGFSQALGEHLETSIDDTGKHYLQRLEQSSQRMTAMIDALMSLSRVAQADMVLMDMDLGILSREVLAEIATRFPQHQPRLSVATPMPIHGDARLIKQLMTKLLENAWQCTMHTADAQIEIGSATENEKMHYFVRDNGIGFDMSLSHKLFVPFQQLHANEALRGQGLGLALAQRVVARHGGHIWAVAEPLHGAQFSFSLFS